MSVASGSSKNFHAQYHAGEDYIKNPIQMGSAFACAFIICAIVEKLFGTANEVSNDFFKVLFPAVSEEVTVLGTLSLVLTFVSSLVPRLPDEWAVMFDWAQVCLLYMVIMFVVVVTVISVIWNKTISRFEKFETQRLGTRGIEVDEKERTFTLAVNKFKLAMRAFGYQKPVFLSRYLRPIGEKNVVTLANLTWKAWLALSGMVVVNALRTKIVDVVSGGDGILNVATFIIICGYGPLLLFIYTHRRLVQRCEQFLQIGAAEAAAVAASMDPNQGALSAVGLSTGGRNVQEAVSNITASRMDLEDPTAFLIWQSHMTTLTVIQVTFFFEVWFGGVFFLSMMYRIFTFNVGLSLFFFCLAVAPMTIFCMMVPWTFVIIAILSSLGTCLDEGQIRRCQKERADEMARFLHGDGGAGDRRNDEADKKNRDASQESGDNVDGSSPAHRVQVKKISSRPLEFNDEDMSRLVFETQRNARRRQAALQQNE